MVTKARIQDGVVAEILTAEPFPPFHPSLVWVNCSVDVQTGYQFDGASFTAPSVVVTAEHRRGAILTRLSQIDSASMRPLRAVASGAAAGADHDKIVALDAEAAGLRTELAAL
jgi:hypothetical protein